MKTRFKSYLVAAGLASGPVLLTLPGSAAVIHSAAASNSEQATEANSNNSASTEAGTATGADVVIEPAPHEDSSRKDVPWLGVSTVEASEALASQLDLPAGAGLLITYVAPDSPAAKAGLKKNDVLVEFGDQSLVHPAQLRKLVRVQKEGEGVKLGFYRAGKHEVVSVKLGKTRMQAGTWQGEEHALKGNFDDLRKQLGDLHLDDAVREQMRVLRESLGNIKIDQKEVQQDIRRGMEEARKAIQEALRNVTNADPMRKVLENLARSGVTVDDKADVVVRSSGKNIKSMVKSDDSGTIVLISNPRLHLTAHDKEGKLLFDGPIESSEERAKVPVEVWDRVEPLLDQMRPSAEQPEPKAGQ
jgi:hypothetical protein